MEGDFESSELGVFFCASLPPQKKRPNPFTFTSPIVTGAVLLLISDSFPFGEEKLVAPSIATPIVDLLQIEDNRKKARS